MKDLNFDIKKLDDFINLLNSTFGNENRSYSVEALKVRFRVTLKSWGSNSVYCFIDLDGNMLFPAGYNAPTKSNPIRGSILSENPLEGQGWATLRYLRH